MAKITANGNIALLHAERTYGSTPVVRVIRSDGRVLDRIRRGNYRVLGRVKPNLTLAEFVRLYQNDLWDVTIDAPEWRDKIVRKE